MFITLNNNFSNILLIALNELKQGMIPQKLIISALYAQIPLLRIFLYYPEMCMMIYSSSSVFFTT